MMIDPVSLAITVALNAASMALTMSQKIEGPRLKDPDLNTSEYGAPHNYFYGTKRFDSCPIIWAEPLREEKRRSKTKGGKYTNYKYYGTWAIAIANVEIDAVTRIWFDRHLIYDATGTGPIAPILGPTFDPSDGLSYGEMLVGLIAKPINQAITVYTGTETQEPDERIQADVDARHGPGSTPAYRGTAYIVFKDIPLEHVGNRIPQVTVEATRNGSPVLPFDFIDITPTTGGGVVVVRDSIAFTLSVGGWSAVDLVTHEVIATNSTPSGSYSPTYGTPGLFYGVGEGTEGPTLLSVDVLDVTNLAGSPAYSAGPREGEEDLPQEYVQEQFEWIQNLNDTIFMTRSSGLAYDGFGVLGGGGTYNSHAYYEDTPDPGDGPAIEAARISGFLRDYDSNAVYGLFTTTAGGLRPSSFGSWPGNSGGIAPPPAWDFVPTRYWGVGLASGLWLLGATGTGGATRGLALYDPVEGEWVATAADAPEGTVELGHVVSHIEPESTQAWIGNRLYDLSDLSTVRTVVRPSGAIGEYYDPVNHALVGSSLGGDFGFIYLDRVTAGGVTLQTVFDDVTTRVGRVPGVDTDSDALAAVNVRGYSWTQGKAKDVIEPLIELHDFDVRPHGFILEALARGGAAGAAIDVAYMGAGAGAPAAVRYTVERTLDTDLTETVSLSFANHDADQQSNTAKAQRIGAATDSVAEISIDLSTYVLTPDEAQPLADRYLRRKWMDGEAVKTSLGRRHIDLEPGDVRPLVLDGLTKRCRLVRLDVNADGTLSTEWKRDGASVATLSTRPGAPADGFNEEQIPAVAMSEGFVLDIPLVTDAHDASVPQLYVAAAPRVDSSVWPGATIYQSDDGGATWQVVFANRGSSDRATWGVTTGALADAHPWLWDRASSVNVSLRTGTLTSTTEAAIDASPSTNLALIGDELVNFTTATLELDGSYTLSGFKRGRRGTEWATAGHAASEEFLLIDSTVTRASMGASDIGQAESFRTLTDGRFTGPVDAFTFTGATMKPYAPVHLRATRDDATGDWTIDFVRRTRVGGAWTGSGTIPLGETTEAYEVVILDGASEARVISVTSPTATYTAAQQTSDFGAPVTSFDYVVYQMSDTAGRGFAAEATAS